MRRVLVAKIKELGDAGHYSAAARDILTIVVAARPAERSGDPLRCGCRVPGRVVVPIGGVIRLFAHFTVDRFCSIRSMCRHAMST